MDKHREAISVIAADVRGFYERRETFRIYHGSTNSTRNSSYRRGRVIYISKLTKVLKVESKTRTALVEPNVPMDRLVEATKKHGLVPPVVMEFPGITVGGGFAGTAGESSSFKYGLFDCTISQIEIVLANGEIVMASGTERSDLFYGAAGSCGTLGVVTLLEIQLIAAKSFVELTYHHATSVSEAIQAIKEGSKNPTVDYIDGIVFSMDSAVVMTGRLTNDCSPGTRIQRYTRAHDPWFYQHAEKLAVKGSGPLAISIPLVDYLFRYDRGAFWGGAHAFRYFMVPCNRATRWALDYYMHTRVMYHALHESGLAEQTVVQDLAVPFSSAQEFIEHVDATLRFYPLWLCPVRSTQQMRQHPHRPFSAGKPSRSDDMLLNVGVWGVGPSKFDQFIDLNRRLESKIRDLSGLKCLYAHVYYTEQEFWEIYDREVYERLRARYHASSMLTVYDKVKAKTPGEDQMNVSLFIWLLSIFWSIWPFSGLYGVFRATIGGDYLMRAANQN